MRPFAEVGDRIMGPLEGRNDDAWFAAPPGRWSPAEIVDHLASAIEQSAKGFGGRTDKPPMTRRPPTMMERLARLAVLGLGWFPVRLKAPSTTVPAARPDRAATEAKLRAGIQAFLDLETRLLPARAHDLFLKHPRLGDLTLPEFMRFHVRHAEHHRKQIVGRLQQMSGSSI